MSELIKTKRAALELSILLWEGLAKTGSRKSTQIKSDWQLSGFREFQSDCPLCEYTKELTCDIYEDCDLCPVYWTATPTPYYPYCQGSLSLYGRWEVARNKSDKAKLAGKIVTLFRQTLNELP